MKNLTQNLLANIPSSFRAVSAVSGQFQQQFHRAVSKQKQFQEKFFVKVF